MAGHLSLIRVKAQLQSVYCGEQRFSGRRQAQDNSINNFYDSLK